MNQTQPQQKVSVPSAALSKTPKKKNVPMAFWIVLTVTAILLVSSMLATTVLLLTAEDTYSHSNVGDSSLNKPNADREQDNGSKPSSATPTRFSKTGISLPSATKTGIYAPSVSEATDISGDTGITSGSVALLDVTNGRAVATKQGSEKIYPASMTKVMTLLVACENANDPTALLTVTAEMVEKYAGTDGGSIGTTWQEGYQMTVEDALYLIIYESDTYACWLLAEHLAGSEGAFAEMMTKRAKALGCANTNFVNSTGLYHENHYTTCFDMAAIMAAAMNNEVASKVLTSYNSYTFDIYENGVKKTNFSAYSAWYVDRLEKYGYAQTAWYYAGKGSDIRLIAGKTGYETIPKSCFVTAGKNVETGTVFVCVQVGAASSKDSTYDTREVYQRYATY